MNIVVEGPDNAGKSTLAHALMQGSKCGYYYLGPPPRDQEAELRMHRQQQDLLVSDAPIVLDRVSCISQQVYSHEQSEGANRIRQAYVLSLLGHGVLFVYCRPSTDWLVRTDKYTWLKGETDADKQRIVNNHIGFISVYDGIMPKIPCLHYDFDNEACQATVRHMVNALKGDFDSEQWLRKLLIRGTNR
jgi:hypothetical protein